MSTVKSWARSGIDLVDNARFRAVSWMRWGGEYGQLERELDLQAHLREAAGWLIRAQDAGSDRGVARGARLGEGYQESYPETTGYIIPTFLELADYFGEDDFRRRAIEMGDWEIEIQMDCGAVMGGVVNPNPTPAVFNTGQVLFGWAALYRRTGERRFADAARRAADWLIAMQDPDGNWIQGNTRFANSEDTVYNVKAAWGLLEAAQACGWDDAATAAVKNADYCLTRQHPNGWYEQCCLSDATRPLLHTVAYAMQGLLGIGRLAQQSRLIDAAERTARSLMERMDSDGFLPGRMAPDFRGTVSWSCLTGIAQTSIVWSDLLAMTGATEYGEARHRANQYLVRRHNITCADQVFRGGLFGSWPFWGDYGRNTVLNWATKFLIDAILLEVKGDVPATSATALDTTNRST